MTFQLDPALLEELDERKASELRQALEDLNSSDPFRMVVEGCEPTVLLSSLTSSGISFSFGSGPQAQDYRLLWSTMRVPIKEYQEVIEGIVQVGSTGGRGRFEAMDYGKKVVHDEAGELLQELLEEIVEIPLSSARRLFTLLFLLKTEMPAHLVQYHRSHF